VRRRSAKRQKGAVLPDRLRQKRAKLQIQRERSSKDGESCSDDSSLADRTQKVANFDGVPRVAGQKVATFLLAFDRKGKKMLLQRGAVAREQLSAFSMGRRGLSGNAVRSGIANKGLQWTWP
jgi:hypothetical protein